MDIDGYRMDVKFLRETGATDDWFTIVKGTKRVTLTAPNGGETWTPGANGAVTWTSAGTITGVTIQLSMDGGATYPYTLGSNLPNTGTTPDLRLRIQTERCSALRAGHPPGHRIPRC